ncbi:MAG: LTA synthase family protein [Oscillospiraceae bacterium]|nr:LTA synthase family protein [Oscillospiraceae bacterium]
MKLRKILRPILWSAFLFLSFLALSAALWYMRKYGDTGFMSILSTFLSPWNGCANSLKESFICYALLPTIGICGAVTLFLLNRKYGKLRIKGKQIYPFSQKWSNRLFLLLSVASLVTAACLVHFPRYVYDSFFTHSRIYEEEYRAPADVEITFPEKKRNLIYIYLESMESSFLSKELGGGCEENLIPELYELARENVNFSHNDGVGGFPRTTHATWTSAAMVSQTAGVPLTIDIAGIDLTEFKGYLPGATTLQDILREEGYYQTLMVGSDASFGGRREYYEQHGADHVYDLYTAREDGLIPSDYMVWWGFEDAKLFAYAKEELKKISAGEQPFAFTLLTVDTHHIDGYSCEYCPSHHKEQYENVLSCSSRQVLEFVRWLQEQEFYDNTTVIISGDHPSMDQQYFARNVDSDYTRHSYNCILNSAVTTTNTKNRDFTPMDMFPTTLAAMGCSIEGERLGLGTNLFSDLPTLSEEMGVETLNRELSKRSDYYNNELIEDET